MNILISNDDGYDAPGIQALTQVMQAFGEVTVVAPDVNRSGQSSAITLQKPLQLKQIKAQHYALNGTPADCVLIALAHLMNHPPDLIVSGINQGHNLADDTLYSGTVGAAMQGHLQGIPSIAFSQVNKDWHYLNDCAAEIGDWLAANLTKLPPHYLLNVNVPNLPRNQIKGWRWCRLGQRFPSTPMAPTVQTNGQIDYWIGPSGAIKNREEDTDFYAVENNFVAITPLRNDLTDSKLLNQHRSYDD